MAARLTGSIVRGSASAGPFTGVAMPDGMRVCPFLAIVHLAIVEARRRAAGMVPDDEGGENDPIFRFAPPDQAVRIVEGVLMKGLGDRALQRDDAPSVTEMAKRVVAALEDAVWR
jgi:hypothetical protein